jgi:hypothetical protein
MGLGFGSSREPKTDKFCVSRVFTAEKANTDYGELPAGPAKTFTQTFGVMQ